MYNNLKDEIEWIGNKYINFEVQPLGDYSKEDFSSTAAYVLLCHSEIESYLESWATLLLGEAKRDWERGITNQSLLFLCTFLLTDKTNFSTPPKKNEWERAINEAIIKHEAIIKSNHGIKIDYICKMFAPLGFDVRVIDDIILNELDKLSRSRGLYAHNSHARSNMEGDTTIKIDDPFSFKKTVERLVIEMENLENLFIDFKNKKHFPKNLR